MHDYGVTIIRPLIYVGEEEIREFAKHVRFCQDHLPVPCRTRLHAEKDRQIAIQRSKNFPNARENLAQASLTMVQTKQAALQRKILNSVEL